MPILLWQSGNQFVGACVQNAEKVKTAKEFTVIYPIHEMLARSEMLITNQFLSPDVKATLAIQNQLIKALVQATGIGNACFDDVTGSLM